MFYADKIMVMGNSKNSRVFNFAILLNSRKFDAREIYMFYSTNVYHIPRSFVEDMTKTFWLNLFLDTVYNSYCISATIGCKIWQHSNRLQFALICRLFITYSTAHQFLPVPAVLVKLHLHLKLLLLIHSKAEHQFLPHFCGMAVKHKMKIIIFTHNNALKKFVNISSKLLTNVTSSFIPYIVKCVRLTYINKRLLIYLLTYLLYWTVLWYSNFTTHVCMQFLCRVYCKLPAKCM